jgi:hypothetical protein
MSVTTTGNTIVADVRAEIIEPSPTFFSNARMLYLINQAQNDYVAKTRVLQNIAYTSSVLGQADYPMPTNWLGSEKIFYNAVTLNNLPNWRPLGATNIEKMGQEYPNFLSTDPSTLSYPFRYWVIGQTMYIYPTPVTNGTNDLFLFYESWPTQLSTLNSLLSIDDSLYPGVRAYVLSKLWKADGEDAKAKDEMSGNMQNPGNYENMVKEGFKWKNKRILDGRWKIDIESYLPFSYSTFTSGTTTGGINPLSL